MSSAFPVGLDTTTQLPDPTTGNNTNNPSHAGLHSNVNDAIKKLEAKLGISSSTPASNTILLGTGAGSSAWTAPTSAQLAAAVTDETGSGSLVFANTPTLITPKADAINEATTSNGVTVAGVNLKSGAITTSNAVGTANITDGAVTGSKLSTSAISLGNPITSSATQTGITSSPVLVTNLTGTYTIPTGGRKVRIEAQVPYLVSSTAATWSIYIYNSATVTGSPIQTMSVLQAIASAICGGSIWFEHTPAAGSQSYCIAISCDNGTGNTAGLSATRLATMSVKVI